MKNLLLFALPALLVIMTGCETIREISLNPDNSGTLVITTDMSAMIGMAKMSGGDKGELEKLGEKKIDTSFLLDKMADSLKELSAEERTLMKKGKLGLQMDMEEGKFITKMEFPFSEPSQLDKLDQLSSKVIQQTARKQMAKLGQDSIQSVLPGGADIPEVSMDKYFATTFTKGVIEKRLIKEKYAELESDEGMKALKEMTSMGVGNSTMIINLPSPAKKAEGKNVTLSEDKKKVTVTSEADDFFNDATALEFRIEY